MRREESEDKAIDQLLEEISDLQEESVHQAERISILELALRLYDRMTMTKYSETFIEEATARTLIGKKVHP